MPRSSLNPARLPWMLSVALLVGGCDDPVGSHESGRFTVDVTGAVQASFGGSPHFGSTGAADNLVQMTPAGGAQRPEVFFWYNPRLGPGTYDLTVLGTQAGVVVDCQCAGNIAAYAAGPHGTLHVDAVSSSTFRGSIDFWVYGPVPVVVGTVPDSAHVQASFTVIR